MPSNITLFGGSGFLGRTLIPLLTQEGDVLRLPTRDLEKTTRLKLCGKPGQILPFICSPRQDAQLAEALRGADVVVNLLGILFESGRSTFQNLHVEFVARLARAAREAGVKKFIHISALGADDNAPSAYGRSKAAGERAIRAFFPEATILRPSLVFGPEDLFFHRLAWMAKYLPALPLFGDGSALFQPVFVGDVASAIQKTITLPSARGQSFELGGPETYSLRALMARICRDAGHDRPLIPLSNLVGIPLATFLEHLPGRLLTRDQLRLLQTNAIVTAGAKGFADLGLKPRAY